MHLIQTFSLLACVGCSIAAPGLLPLEVEKRGCTSNNCLRDLKNAKFSASAGAFCSSLIRPTYYSTVLATATAYNTVASVTPQATATSTSVIVQEVDSVTTSTIINIQNHYRRAGGLVIPSYASDCNVAAITSACSCFLAGTAAPSTTTIPTTVTVTTTLPATYTAPTNTLTTTTSTTSVVNSVATVAVTDTLLCGVQGTANQGVSYIDSVGYPSSVSWCPRECTIFGHPSKSFYYDASQKVCYCYAGTVAESTHPDSGSSILWYDVGCPV